MKQHKRISKHNSAWRSMLYRVRWTRRGVCACACAFLLGLSLPAGAADTLLVLYPQIREPYRQVFLNVVDGIEAAHSGGVETLELAEDDQPERLQHWLQANPVRGIISLGKRSLNMVSQLPNAPPTVVGAVVIEPQSSRLPGISLVPDPNTIFAKIRQLLPKVKRIQAVYPDPSAQWLVDRAKAAAAARGLTLVARPAADVRQMALLYRDVLQDMAPETDALWIAVDGASPDRPMLQTILEASWRRKLWVFSGNLSDVKKGALFSFFPDNQAMGRDLVALLKAPPHVPVTVEPVRELQMAVNLRTADHLNLNFGREERQAFSLMYPPPLDR